MCDSAITFTFQCCFKGSSDRRATEGERAWVEPILSTWLTAQPASLATTLCEASLFLFLFFFVFFLSSLHSICALCHSVSCCFYTNNV